MHLSNRLHTYICKICICVRSNIFLKYLPNILINIIWLSSGIPSSVFNLTYSNSQQISQILTYIHTHMRPYLYLYLVVCPRYCYCGCRHWILPTELHRLHNLHNLLNWAGKWHSKCQRNRRRQNSLLCCSWWWQISTSGAHGDQLATNTFSCMCIIQYIHSGEHFINYKWEYKYAAKKYQGMIPQVRRFCCCSITALNCICDAKLVAQMYTIYKRT